MSALVCYDSSSDSDGGPSEAPVKTVHVLKKRPKGPVKISIPKVNKSDSDSDGDEPAPKRTKQQSDGGLTALLPPPKLVRPSSRSMIPHTVTRSMIPHTVSRATKKQLSKNKSVRTKPVDSDSDDDTPTSFFSLDQQSQAPIPEQQPPIPNPQTPIPEQPAPTPEQPAPIPGKSDSFSVGPSLPTDPHQYGHYDDYSNNEQYSRYGNNEQYRNVDTPTAATGIDISEEQLRRLAGGRGRFEPGLANITEIREDDVKDRIKTFQKYNNEDSVNKFFQNEAAKMDEPTGQQKRKHQLSYLAHQAKANELELSKHWAAAATNKRETRMKYGF